VRAAEVIAIRWPNGRHLLDDFYELLRDQPDTQEQVQLVRTILDRCFNLEFGKGGTREDLLRTWELAGRRKLTPMTVQQLTEWVAATFPRIPPTIGVGWITEEVPSLRDGDAGMVYFSNEPFDSLLRSIWH